MLEHTSINTLSCHRFCWCGQSCTV